MPIGFGLSLAANEKSMETFSKMSEEQKMATVKRADICKQEPRWSSL